MNKPLYNAGIAFAYISIVVLSINFTSRIPNAPEGNLLVPIVMISLLVLSVALMGFLFFYQPVLLLLDGKRAEAIRLFFKTVGIFAAFAVISGILALIIMI
jgi:hypothetical protein